MTTPPDELELIETALRHLEGTLSPEKTGKMWAALAVDPARMRKFAALVMQRVQLVELGRDASVPRATSRLTRGRMIAGAAALAALSAVVVIGVRLGWAPGPGSTPAGTLVARSSSEPASAQPDPGAPAIGAPQPAAARIEAVQGDVWVVSGTARALARAGQALTAADGVTTGGGRAHASLRMAGDTRLDLGPATIVGAPSSTASTAMPVLPVVQGRIFADVRGQPLVVNSPLGEVRATTTARFRIEVRPEDTRVEVHQGAVRVTVFSTGATADVGAGALATLWPDRDIQIEHDEPPAPIAFALQADPRELSALRRMPARLLDSLGGWPVDRDGLVAINQQGFRCAGEQRHPVLGFVTGAATGNRLVIDKAWRALEGTIKFQAPDGSFLDSVVCDADWLGEVAPAMVVLMQSEWERPYRKLIKALLPPLARVAAFLAAPAQIEELRRADAKFSKGYFLHSAAFAFAGLLTEDPALQAFGREYLVDGLRLQRVDGAFLLYDGVDSAYQAIILHHLAGFALRFPDPRHESAVRIGGQWLMSQINAAGDLDVRANTRTGPSCVPPNCSNIDWNRMAWGLLYYGVDRDPRAIELAQRVRDRRVPIRE